MSEFFWPFRTLRSVYVGVGTTTDGQTSLPGDILHETFPVGAAQIPGPRHTKAAAPRSQRALMKNFLKNLLRTGAKAKARKAPSQSRKPAVEALETRQLMAFNLLGSPLSLVTPVKAITPAVQLTPSIQAQTSLGISA